MSSIWIRNLLLSLILIVFLEPAYAQTGSISGFVRNASSQGLASTVFLSTSSGDYITQTDTDSSGNYAFSGLFNGVYRVNTLYSSRAGQSYIDELYNNITCLLGTCDLTAGANVTVAGGGAVTGINFTLAAAGAIAGTVSGPSGGTSATLYLYTATGQSLRFYSANGSGVYNIGGLTSGNYFLLTHNEKGLVDQLYNGFSCPGKNCNPVNGTPITVTAGSTTSNINFSLPTGGVISGTVRNLAGTRILDSAQVNIYDGAGTLLESRSSSFDGTYHTAIGLPTGGYFLTAFRTDYVLQVYSGVNCPSACSPLLGSAVSVGTGGAAGGVDFGLASGFDLTAKIKKSSSKSKTMAVVTIKNEGLNATGQFTVKTYLSETNPKSTNAKVIKTSIITTLAGGASQNIKIKRRKIKKLKYVVVEADALNEVVETDETNNGAGKKMKK